MLLLITLVLGQVTWALAGTTGGLGGNVYDERNAPVVGASVTATSPSGTASTTTDTSGHFVFLTLNPDTYTVSIKKDGLNPVSQGGVTVFADNTVQLTLRTEHAIREIGHVSAKAANDLVKAGTTSDVYSVNASTAAAAAALGGGGSLNSAYSALASAPGLYIPSYQQGWSQFVYIRGGKYDQVGFEYDGVPVNRAFDNYAASTLSNNGQQELQVYTGGAPASASAGTISGFINQVIRTGTYPGFGNLEAGIGAPIFYHQARAEAGGATPNRLFSYYVGYTGYDQQYRYFSQANGADVPNLQGVETSPYSAFLNGQFSSPNVSLFAVNNCILDNNGYFIGPFSASAGTPGAKMKPGGMANDPGCFLYGSPEAGQVEGLSDREGVVNFHVGIPHHGDSGRDDVQLLYSVSALHAVAADSPQDYYGTPAFYNATIGADVAAGLALPTAPFNWPDGYIFPQGTAFGQPATGITASQYFFPSSPTNRAFQSQMPFGQRSGQSNDSAILKLQYQHNIGSNAYVRLFGYTFYSDWLMNSPILGRTNQGGLPISSQFAPDYELINHTKGLEFQAADQINPEHPLTLTGNYATSASLRWSNSTYLNGLGSLATSYTDGVNCYVVRAGVDNAGHQYNVGDLGPCYSQAFATVRTFGTFGRPTPPAPAIPGVSFLVTNAKDRGLVSTTTPKFSSFSLTDNWRPNDRLNINAGIRYDRFEYDLGNTSYNGQDFWTAAASREFCYDPTTLFPIRHPQPPGVPPPGGLPVYIDTVGPCPVINGVQTLHPNGMNGALLLSNQYDHTLTSTVWEPRFGFTYTQSPNTVWRFSYARQAEPANVAYVQYDDRSGRAAGSILFGNFFQYGFTTPRHDVGPEIGSNFDLSFERHIPGSDASFKITPFSRVT
ncbi:MAG: TonB-dependent receptor, partial [Candidatus Eremiobacteraeota bacterium]|nr:TonB-dependent receptor [Candidatus Eremiobacteraeota bacterium]